MMAKDAWRFAFICLALFITWQTLTPSPEEAEPGIALARWLAEILLHDPKRADKIAHFLAYAALGGSAAFAGFSLMGRHWPVVIAIALYGAALEGVQGFGGVRSPEIADAFANGLGALISFPAALLFAGLMNRRGASA